MKKLYFSFQKHYIGGVVLKHFYYYKSFVYFTIVLQCLIKCTPFDIKFGIYLFKRNTGDLITKF